MTWRVLCVGGPSAGEVRAVDRWTFAVEEPQPPISAREDPPAWIEAPRDVVYHVREIRPGAEDTDRRTVLLAVEQGFDLPEWMLPTLGAIARREGCVGREVTVSEGMARAALGKATREIFALFDQG